MKDCIQKVIKELSAVNSPDMQETLLEARLLVEKFRGVDGWHGISSRVEDAEITPESIRELRKTLIEFAQQHRGHPDVGSALWALSGFYDVALTEFFFSEMYHHYLSRNSDNVWQTDCALGVILNGGVGSGYNADRHSHDAYFDAVRNFLQMHGKLPANSL
jgi:hypothetical protein